MVGIFVDHDLVAVPEPVTAQGQVKGGDAESEAAKPKTTGAASGDAPDVSATEATGEPAVLPGMIEVEAGIASSGIVSNPLTVMVNVRSLRVTFLVRHGSGGRAMRGRWTMLGNVAATDCVTASLMVVVLCESGKGKKQRCSKN